MSIVGVLPASGKASRIGGIPKFCIPISDERSLIQWHVEKMLEVCDEVRVATRSEWVPIIQNMDMNIKIIIREPSTMSDAIKFVAGDDENVLVGMPDTFILNSSNNPYKEMLKEKDADIVLGSWDCTEDLKGKVGQILLFNDKVIGSQDKSINCNYMDMWGAILFRNNMVKYIDPKLEHPGKQLEEWINNKINIKAVKPGGQYMDIGTLKGLKQLYKEMDNA